jgi:hypothetical protein
MNFKIVLAFLVLAAFVALSEQAKGNTKHHTTHHSKHPKRRSHRTRHHTRHPKRRSHRTRHRTKHAKTTKTKTTTTTATTTLVTTTAAMWYQWLGYDCTAAFSQGYPIIATFLNVEKCVYPSAWCSIVNNTNPDAVWINNPGNCAKLCYENENCGFFDYNGNTLVCRLHSGNINDNYQEGFCLKNQNNLNTGWIFSRINLGRG